VRLELKRGIVGARRGPAPAAVAAGFVCATRRARARSALWASRFFEEACPGLAPERFARKAV